MFSGGSRKRTSDLRVFEYMVWADPWPGFEKAMMRALLDTMIFGKIVADQSLKAGVLKVVGFGEVVSRRQEDQIGRIPDQTMRDKISGIPRTVIATGAAVWDNSNWDEAKFDEGIGPATVEDAFRGNPRDIPDALVAATLSDADVLVTEDKDLRKRVEVKARGSGLVIRAV